MDIVITTSDGDVVEEHVDQIRLAISKMGPFVNSITVVDRR